MRLCLWQCPDWGGRFIFYFSRLVIEIAAHPTLAECCAYSLAVRLWSILYRPLLDWVCLFVEPDLFLGLPLAVTLLPAGLAVFPMLAALVWFRLFSDQPRFAASAPLGLFCAWYWYPGCVPTY